MITTIASAFATWKESCMPLVIAAYGSDDDCALSEDWNKYTDGLCKDGELTYLQYHYCPAWDAVHHGDTWSEELAFILEQMCVTFESSPITERDDGLLDEVKGSHHFKCLVKRGDRALPTKYSKGPALGNGNPELEDVMYSLLLDAGDILDGCNTFEEWADNYGMDTDSRKAERTYDACKATAEILATMFDSSELDDLREIANEI